MLLTFITTIAVLLILYLAINICRKVVSLPNYDFSTGASKPLIIFSHILFGIGFSVIASEIIVYFSSDDQESLWAVYGIFLTLAVLSLFMQYELYFTYEAIRGDLVYVRRFFRTKIINVNDIRHIHYGGTTVFCDRKNKTLFNVGSATQGLNKFISLINERQFEEDSASREEALAEEKTILTKIGQEYKAGYTKRRKTLIMQFAVFGIATVAGMALGMYFLDINTIVNVVLSCFFAIAWIFNFVVFIRKNERERSEDDFSLGKKYQLNNKKVKGASRELFTIICVLCGFLMLFGAVFLLIGLNPLGKLPNYDEHIHVTGEVEYYRKRTGTDGYIAIGLRDSQTEYRLTSLFLEEFNYSFFDEVKVGDTVTLFVDNDSDREFSLRGVPKTQWNSFYYLSSGDKEYFTYENYIKSHEENDRIGYTIAWFGGAAMVVSIVAIIIGYFICRSRKKGECIEIYK